MGCEREASRGDAVSARRLTRKHAGSREDDSDHIGARLRAAGIRHGRNPRQESVRNEGEETALERW